MVLDQIDWELSAKECKSLHQWSRFDNWTGRVEDLEENARGIKVKVALNNNGRVMMYYTFYGTVTNKSTIYRVVLGLHEGGSMGSPVLISGRFALPPVKASLSYDPGNSMKKLALGLCSGMVDIPVTFTAIEPVTAIVEDQ